MSYSYHLNELEFYKLLEEPTLQSIKNTVDSIEFDKLLEEQLAYGSRLTKAN